MKVGSNNIHMKQIIHHFAILKQGDTGHAYYMVISGIGSVKKSKKSEITDNFVISKPTHFVKVSKIKHKTSSKT